MKKLLIINVLLFICACTYVQAQINLVRNPGFETYSACPFTYDLAYYATGWNAIDSNWFIGSSYPSPACLPDYINSCATFSSGVSCPIGGYFFQNPHSGNGMMQVRFYDDGRTTGYISFDYLQGRLEHTLVAGQRYCVTFYIVRENNCNYAINNIGVYFDNGNIDTSRNCTTPQIAYTPQIIETIIISDTLNWTKIQGSFIATGTENFITFGEFFDTAHIAKIRFASTGAWGAYLIDDVSVIASDALATAGPDEWMGAGDSTYIGVDSNGDGMPCYWYVLGSSTRIDSGGRIKVRPAVTTSYEVVMDLCGTITRDTVVVHVCGRWG